MTDANKELEALKREAYEREQELNIKLGLLKAELKKAKQRHWAELNTARCLLLNFVEDLSGLTEKIQRQELVLKKALFAEQALKDVKP